MTCSFQNEDENNISFHCGNGEKRILKESENGRTQINVFPEKNITYMWCDINVFTSKTSQQRKKTPKISKLFSSIDCCKSFTDESKRKHILQNGMKMLSTNFIYCSMR